MFRRTHRTTHRRPRRLCAPLVASVAGMVALGIGAGSGATWSLWSDAFTNPSLQVATGAQVGITFGRVGGSAVAATAESSVLTAGVTRADGQMLLAAAPRAVAIPLVVRMRADGHTGINYSLTVPAFPAGTLLAASTIRLFPVSATTDAAAQAACTPPAAPVAQPATAGIIGIAAGVDTGAPNGLAADYWCLTAVYSGSGGTYENTATAAGVAPSGVAVQADATWTAFVIAPGSTSLVHELHLPGGP